MTEQFYGAVSDEALEEFSAATLLEKFHRFAIVKNGDDVVIKFGLLGKDGINRYFEASRSLISALAAEFMGLTGTAHRMANNLPQDRIAIPFRTAFTFTLVPQGGDDGHVIFQFVTPTGETFETHIGPELGAQFGEQIELALSSMPRPPAKRKKESFFGQECRGRMLRTKPR